jgi:type IV secretion system protein VirB1
LELLNTGHSGSLSSIHSDSPEMMFDRLASMAARGGAEMNKSQLIEYSRQLIDVVIQWEYGFTAVATSRRFNMQKLPKFAVTLLALACTLGQAWADEQAPVPFSEPAKCAPTVHPQTLKSLIGNESTYNPYAIGVVDGRLERQPKSLREAATAERLEREGFRFSVGIGQLLVTNMRALGLSYAQAFEPCRNLQAISELMVKNYTKALTANPNPQEALRDSLSMYYSGNPVRGYRPDKEGDLSYVQKVVVGALNPSSADPIVPAVEATAGDEAIPVAVASPGHEKRLCALVQLRQNIVTHG